MTILAEYRCLECGEVFENRLQAVAHHFETKHQNYEITGADYKITIKS